MLTCGFGRRRVHQRPQADPIYTFPAEAHDNPLEFYGIFPGEQIGLSSDPELLEAARNTVVMADVTSPLQENAFQEIFPSFVRAALNATYILGQLTAVIDKANPPNGYLQQGGGGIETAGATVAVNDMLLHSWGGFLRLFAVWPLDHDASFEGLRAVGAFVVSATLENSTLSSASILSEVGGNCTIQWPWGSSSSRGSSSTDVSRTSNPNSSASSTRSNSGDRGRNGNGPPVVRDAATGKQVAAKRIRMKATADLWQFPTDAGVSYTLSVN